MSSVEQLVHDLIPHSPSLGLYVAPDIPDQKLNNALEDFAGSVSDQEVLALYDATLSGNSKDGAVFTADRVVFQNNNLSPVQEVRYDDIVGVKTKRKFLGGKKVRLDVNRGRATVKFVLDFSGKPEAADFVGRYLYDAMMHSIETEQPASRERTAEKTDVHAVRRALEALVKGGQLTDADRARILRALDP